MPLFSRCIYGSWSMISKGIDLIFWIVLGLCFRVIASGTIPDPGSLKAKDTTILDVPVKVPHSVLVSLVRDIGRDWDIDYQLHLGLVIDLPVFGNITIPLSQSGEVKLPTLSDFWKKPEAEAEAKAA